MGARKVRGMFTDPERRAVAAGDAYLHLLFALRDARQAGAVQLIPRVRWALKSAEGAKRHAIGRLSRARR